jgi:hypothetical protein
MSYPYLIFLRGFRPCLGLDSSPPALHSHFMVHPWGERQPSGLSLYIIVRGFVVWGLFVEEKGCDECCVWGKGVLLQKARWRL